MKMQSEDRRSRAVPTWLAALLTVLIVLSPIAVDLALTKDTHWQDYRIPALMGSILLLVMVYWLLHTRHVEASLREERNLLRILIDHLPDRIFVKDTRGRRVISNSADWQSTGATKMEDVIGKTVLEIYPPELAAKYWADDQEILEEGQPILNREEPAVDAQGNPLWTLATQVPLRDSGQNLIGIVGIIRDITAFKRSIEAERAAEERYRQIFKESVEGIYQSTPDGTFITINPAMAQIFGYASADEMITLANDLERQFYVQPSRRGEFKRMIETTGRIADFESEVYRKDGGSLWISEHGRVVRDEQGAVQYYEGTIVDITERKRAEAARHTAEAALRDSEARFSSAFAYAAIGMALVAPDGRWIKVNRALCNLVGYSEEELLGMTFQDITHPDDLELDLNYVQHMLAGEIQTYKMEKRYFHKSGRIVWILLSVSLVRDAAGAPQYFISQIQDITDRKQAEETQQETHRKQSIWISELEQRTRDITLLNEMSDLIQCCPTADEAYRVVQQQTQWLFPQDSGALYILNSSRSLVEAKAVWGEPFGAPLEFQPSDCWAFRRGQLHVAEAVWAADPNIDQPLLFCNHVQPPMPEAYICIPLIAQGETLGMLHLRHLAPPVSNPSDLHGVWYAEATRQLARTVADSLALSLSNLNLRESLRQQSIRDPLTGLFNRRYMEESLDREVARATRAKQPLGVIMLDIDHFKRFNDMFGHPAGDAILRELGGLFRSQTRDADIACRYGGEEFALILPEASVEIARQRADMICKAVRKLEVQQGSLLLGRVTASLGVAEFPSHGQTGEAVIRMADLALYQAKQWGRDQVRIAASMEGQSDTTLRNKMA